MGKITNKQYIESPATSKHAGSVTSMFRSIMIHAVSLNETIRLIRVALGMDSSIARRLA